MLQDRFGLPLSTRSASAVDAYVTGVDLMLSANAGAEAQLDAALAEDPDFALAHAAKARLCQMQARGPEAKAAAERARTLAATLGARERGHVEAVALLIDGKGAQAWAQVQNHVAAFPRDAVPLSLALGVYGLLGFSGRVDHHEAQLALLQGLSHAWDDDWWFLTYLGWSHVETGAVAQGVALLERALAGNPRNAHAAHARAHGYYEAGEAEAGRRFVADWLPDYARDALLHCHLTWHQALFALQLGDADAALALYADGVQPAVAQSPPLFTLADSASMLWRLGAYGHAVSPAQWAEVRAVADAAFPHAGLPFADVHATMATTACHADATARIGEIATLLDNGKLAAGPVVAALCRGVAAFAAGDYDAAVNALEAAYDDLPRIGGSHAQRDVVEDTLIVAYQRAGRREDALQALARRAGVRARHLDETWLARIAP
jgi:tetratricopeptide (TPR) repeat protein